MQTNLCTYPKIVDGATESNTGEKCGLYFRNLYELIHHIEEEHIPLIEAKKNAELKQLKEQFGSDPSMQDQYDKAYSALLNQPIPLSLICKLKPFPKGHKVHPIPPPKQRTMKFCYYKPKVQPTTNEIFTAPTVGEPSQQSMMVDQFSSIGQNLPISTCKKLAQVQRQSISAGNLGDTNYNRQEEQTLSLATSKPSATEEISRRLYCEVEGCRKAYKNQQGLRNHMRNMHGLSLDGTSAASSPHQSSAGIASGGRLSATEESILSRQLPGRQSPFVVPSPQPIPQRQTATPLGSPPAETIGTLLATSGLRSAEPKYQCQYCGKYYKTMVNLNKHLIDSHNVSLVASPVLVSAAPGGGAAQIQQQPFQSSSPHRAIPAANSNSIAILPASSKGAALQQSHFVAGQSPTSSFIAPTITTRHHQPNLFGRPSAPVPPSTPPSASSSPAIQQLAYSPQNQQQIIASNLMRSPNNEPHQHHNQEQGQQHFFIGQHQQVDQQPPILHPQQQPTNTQRYRYTYHQPQQQQGQQQLQPMDQQMYSGGTYFAGQGQPTGGYGTTTIFVTTQQRGESETGQGQQPQQQELDQQQMAPYTRPYYRQQTAHYMVEPAQPQQHSAPAYPITQVGQSRHVRAQFNHSAQQPQGQPSQHQPMHHHHQPTGGRGHPYHQQPYMVRTTPTHHPQHQQRIFGHHQTQQQQHYYHHQQQQQRQQRSSPATVAAVLAANSPATGDQQSAGGGGG